MWFRVDDAFAGHPKVFATSPAALGLWVVAGAWSSGARTGGVIPRHALARLLPGAEALADELVVAGLWEPDGRSGGYRFHDWEDYNPSAAEAQAAKTKQATGGKLGNHRRWHVGRGHVDPSCPWCAEDRPADRVPDRSTDRGDRVGGESGASRPDAGHIPAGAAAGIGSDRSHPARTAPEAAPAQDDQPFSDRSTDRVPDGGSESPPNPPSRPVPTRPGQVTSTSTGGAGGAAAGAASTDDQPELPAEFTDPIATPAPAKPKKAEPRGHRIPEDFTVTEDMRAWAAEKAPGAGWADHEAFLDHWRSTPGARGRKVDWVATWRNWMRRASTDNARRTGRGPAARPTTSERVEGWLTVGTDQAHPDQLALPAPAAQEVTGWPAA